MIKIDIELVLCGINEFERVISQQRQLIEGAVFVNSMQAKIGQ